MVSRQGVYAGFLITLLAVLMSALPGCSNEYQEDITGRYADVKQRLTDLGSKIDAGEVANALLIKTYAEQLEEKKPELKEVVKALAQDGTTAGPMYTSLVQRLEKVNQNPENRQAYIPAFEELESLWAAADRAVYNDSLIDVVNTLADLSGGELPRVNIPRDADTASLSGASGRVPGSYLVGNPNYGQWSQNSSGGTFWEWYGMYSLFSNLAGGFGGGMYHRGPVFYEDWHRRPRYSYHHDYGRSTYGSRADRSAWNSGRQRLSKQGIRTPKPKNYGSVTGQKRVSTYASMRSRSASALRAGHRPSVRRTSTSTTRRASTTKRTSTYFGSSSRGTSRRSYGGK